MQKVYNLHDVISEDLFPFKPEDYSEFKYGNKLIAKRFGIDLAKGFIEKHKNDLQEKDIVVLPSPYSFINTASGTMSMYFIYQLNYWLKSQGKKTAEIVKIKRDVTYKDDYGKLSAEKRLELIGNDKFHLDVHALKGKLLLFIDDIKITGSHQFVIERTTKNYNLDNDRFFIYFAALKNSTIHPKIENFFNNAKIKTLHDLNHFVEDGNFQFNTRVVKFILSRKKSEFEKFICDKNLAFKEDLYTLALGNGYDKMRVYVENINNIEKLLFVIE